MSRKFSEFFYVFDWLEPLEALLQFLLVITFFIFLPGLWCYFITRMMFSYVFVFGDFNANHKDWLTYSSGTNRPRNHIQMFNFPTQIPHLTLIYLFLLTLVFVLQLVSFIRKFRSCCCLSFYWLASNSKRDSAYDYSYTDWDGLCDHLKDVPWQDIFKSGTSVAATEFCEQV